MRVLITGGSGFVGSHACRALLGNGHSVRLLVRDIDKAKAIIAPSENADIEFVLGDITDKASLSSAFASCDGLLHCAALTPLGGASTEQLFAANVTGVKNVIGTALRQGISRVIYISSITAIFDTDARNVHANAALKPSKMPYGKSKIAAEQYVRSLQAQGEPVSIVYPSGIIGPEDPGFSDAFKALQHRINNGFRLIDDGGMQHIDVRDLATFIVQLLERDIIGRFVLPGPYCQWSQLANIIEEATGAPLQRINVKGWKLRLIGRVMDAIRLFRKVDTPISAETMRYASQWPVIENTEFLATFNMQLRSTTETFSDSLKWMLEAGYLKPEQAPKLNNAAKGHPQ